MTTSTMKAAVRTRFGGPEVVSVAEVERPRPGDDEVLIRVEASTVSAADHRTRSGDLPKGLGLMVPLMLGWPRPKHRILGMDAAGTVESVGSSVTRFSPGDRVFSLLGFAFGGHAQYAVKKADRAIAIAPTSLSAHEAAALVFGGTTALSFMAMTPIAPGTEVLVNGASGSVGSMAVQIAKARGAIVTAVTSERNRELALSLGADEVLDYESADFTSLGRTWDVIVECVGNAPFERVERSLKPGGALLLVIMDLKGMLGQKRNARRSGKVVTGTGAELPAGGLPELARLADAGTIRPVIDRTFELDDVVDAHRFVDVGRKRGNVVLAVS